MTTKQKKASKEPPAEAVEVLEEITLIEEPAEVEAKKKREEKPVEKDEHPDKVYDDSVYRWVGHLIHKRTQRNFQKAIVGAEIREVFIGEEIIEEQYSGFCASCKTELYDLVSGPGSPGIGNHLVSYNTGASGEIPATYCQNCNPSKGLGRTGIPEGELIPGEAWRMQT